MFSPSFPQSFFGLHLLISLSVSLFCSFSPSTSLFCCLSLSYFFYFHSSGLSFFKVYLVLFPYLQPSGALTICKEHNCRQKCNLWPGQSELHVDSLCKGVDTLIKLDWHELHDVFLGDANVLVEHKGIVEDQFNGVLDGEDLKETGLDEDHLVLLA